MSLGTPRHRSTARGSTRTRSVVFLALVVVSLAVAPATAAAQDSRTGGSVVVGEGETTGDLQAFAGNVVVLGTVDGDLEAFAGNVRIVGTVTGNVSGAAGNVVVAGTVEGDVEVSGGNVELQEGSSIGGTFQAGAGVVTIGGSIGEDARVGGEEIVVGPTASIEGDLEYNGPLTVADGATIGGETIRNEDLGTDQQLPAIPGAYVSAYFFLVNLLVGLLLLAVFPSFSRGLVDRTTDRPGITGLVGFGAFVGIPIALVLVAITVVGFPLSVAGFFVWVLGIWIGSIYGRYLVGAWLLEQVDRENRWLALVVGVIVVAVAVRIPIVGGLLDLAVLIWGLGALALGLVAAYRRGRGTSGAAAEAGAPEEGGPAEPAAGGS